jgi:hypothetical protein
MVDLIGVGVVDFSWIEHRKFTLENVNKAFNYVGDRPGGFENVVVLPHRAFLLLFLPLLSTNRAGLTSSPLRFIFFPRSRRGEQLRTTGSNCRKFR